VRAYLFSSQYDEAFDLITRLQETALTTGSATLRDAIHAWFEQLASAETIQVLVASLPGADPVATAKIQRLIQTMGAAAIRSLLIALAEEENRSRRRKLFDFLVSLGPLIVHEVTRFLSDSRWYVVRNMIVLLRAVNDRSAIPEIRRIAQHRDLRVRMEAIKALLALEPSVPRSLLEQAINDPDPKMAETAITLVGSYGIREAVGPLLEILDRRDFFGARRPVRVKAIRALGELAEPSALPRMEQFFREPFLPWPAREERRAAFEVLAAFPPDHRARFVELGLRSRDAHIREICRRLTAE
jgi:HEAT repeat protein